MSYTSKYTGQQIDEKLDQVSNKVNQSDLLDKVYPVGSIYLAYNHTSPASLFGGTWTRISQRMLWGSSVDGTIGATGGAEAHTHTSAAHTHTVAEHTHSTSGVALTVNQMPAHSHAVCIGNNHSNRVFWEMEILEELLVDGLLVIKPK